MKDLGNLHYFLGILLYVDDLVVTGPELDEINRVKSQLSGAFEMKDLGDPKPSATLCVEYVVQFRHY